MCPAFSSIPKAFFRHLCVLYQRKEEAAVPLEAFCDHAARARGRLLWLLDAPVPWPDSWEPDQIVRAQPYDWFFDPQSGIDFHRLDDLIEDSRRAGREPVYLVVDLAWLLDTDYPERQLFNWENGVNSRVEQANLHVLCLYETPRFSRSFLPYILFLHPFLWQGGSCQVNPHYLPSKWHTLFPMPQNLWISPAQLPTPVPDAEEPRTSLMDCSRVRSYMGRMANDLNNLLNIMTMKLDLVENAPDLPRHLYDELAELHETRNRMVREISRLQERFTLENLHFSDQEDSHSMPAFSYWKAASPANGALPKADSPARHPTVVVVDDEPAILRLAERILEREGYRVRVFTGATELLAQIEREPFQFDLLVTDVVMPNMNGFELFLRLQERFPRLPTVFMSGYTASAFDDNGQLPPNSRFLNKPFLPRTLIEAVRSFLPPHP